MTRENILPREDILRMSREAGLNMGTIQQYERFTQLVANALAALQPAALRAELDLIPDAGKMVGPERQPLTEEECIEAIDASFELALASGNVSNASVIRYVRVIEAKHGIKEQP